VRSVYGAVPTPATHPNGRSCEWVGRLHYALHWDVFSGITTRVGGMLDFEIFVDYLASFGVIKDLAQFF